MVTFKRPITVAKQQQLRMKWLLFRSNSLFLTKDFAKIHQRTAKNDKDNVIVCA